jgi:hypothetical protein
MIQFEKYNPNKHTTDQVDDFGDTKYKFILTKKYDLYVPIYPPSQKLVTSAGKIYIKLEPTGLLSIFDGYAWDGVSGGISIQSDTNHRGGLVHDALYQMIRLKLIPSDYRAVADRLFYDILREDGMNIIRANYYYYAVRMFGSVFS